MSNDDIFASNLSSFFGLCDMIKLGDEIFENS